MEVTGRSQVRNSTEFRRFSSPHPLFFSEFLDSNDKGMAARAYIGREDPVAPGVGDRPLSPVGGGRQGPLLLLAAIPFVIWA